MIQNSKFFSLFQKEKMKTTIIQLFILLIFLVSEYEDEILGRAVGFTHQDPEPQVQVQVQVQVLLLILQGLVRLFSWFARYLKSNLLDVFIKVNFK